MIVPYRFSQHEYCIIYNSYITGFIKLLWGDNLSQFLSLEWWSCKYNVANIWLSRGTEILRSANKENILNNNNFLITYRFTTTLQSTKCECNSLWDKMYVLRCSEVRKAYRPISVLTIGYIYQWLWIIIISISLPGVRQILSVLREVTA